MKKSIEQIVAVLACVYLGIPYMPLEEDIPAERLKRCLANSQSEILFSDAGTPVPEQIHVITPDTVPEKGERIRPVVCNPDDLFVVIHTSGSTGTPKAVMVAHGALQNNLMCLIRKYHLTQEDAAIAITNLAHDMSMFDVFGMLSIGGKIVMPTHEKRKDPMHWLKIMKQANVTVWNSVPAMMEMFMASMNYHEITLHMPMKLFMHGGDYVKPEIAKFLYEMFPTCKVLSVGGPTETTLWNIYHEITLQDIQNQIIPYGKPIDNNQYLILDKNLDAVAVGVTGYLYASGIGVAKGYLGDDERTKEKFILHPETGVRMYYTGDMGKYLPDGDIIFMGREDAQIKINGKRIETEEIANVILQCDNVTACAVIGDIELKRITAFYCAETPIAREIFRDMILQYLPEYMMPTEFIRLDALPLTPNGKIDRKSLLKTAKTVIEETPVITENLTPEELEIKAIYDSFTGNSSYSPDDSFLIAGGNSLRAIQFVFALKNQYHVEIGLVDFFQHSSLRELTAYVHSLSAHSEKPAQSLRSESEFVIAEKTETSETEPFGLTELQQAYLVGRKSQMSLNIVTHGYLELECYDYDHEKFVRVAKKLIARHDALRSLISYDGTQRFVKEVPPFEIPVIDLTGRSEKLQQKYIQFVQKTMICYKLNLEEIPLIRVHVNKLGEAHAFLQIYFDTLIIDGVSYEVLYNELETLYEDENAELPEIGVTFKDYVAFKEYQKTTQEYEKAKKYWLKRIETLPEAVTLPLLKKPEEVNGEHGIVKECKISMDTWLTIKKFAEKRGITGFAVLFTAFSEVIARWNYKKRFLLSIPKADRPPFHENIDNVVGECATFLLFEVESRPEETFEQTCIRNQQQIWEANENSSFSGVEVLREVYKYHNSYGSALVPVVFSTLAEIPQKIRKHFKTNYSETLTSQVWIDIDAQIRNDEMQFSWNVPNGLFDEAMLDDMTRLEMELLNRVAEDEQEWFIRQETMQSCCSRTAHRYS